MMSTRASTAADKACARVKSCSRPGSRPLGAPARLVQQQADVGGDADDADAIVRYAAITPATAVRERPR